MQSSAFLHYMESGLWYVFVFNDGEDPQEVAFIGDTHGELLEYT